MLAWRLQAEAFGGLDAETRRRLRLRGRGAGRRPRARRRRAPAPGLAGRTVEVVVEEDGFRWEGQRYASLSAAATAIAGTRWNGPQFFGLRRPAR